jgi:hypothetical protein
MMRITGMNAAEARSISPGPCRVGAPCAREALERFCGLRNITHREPVLVHLADSVGARPKDLVDMVSEQLLAPKKEGGAGLTGLASPIWRV